MIQVTEEAWLGLKEEVKFLRAENDRLREQVAGLTAALIPFLRYANELLWGDRGVRDDDVVLRWPYYGSPRVIVRRSDFKALRAALPVPNPGLSVSPVVLNPGLPISPVVPNPGLPISPVAPTPARETEEACTVMDSGAETAYAITRAQEIEVEIARAWLTGLVYPVAISDDDLMRVCRTVRRLALARTTAPATEESR